MLNKIIDWSARNIFMVLLATLFIVVAGVYAVVKTPIDAHHLIFHLPNPALKWTSVVLSAVARVVVFAKKRDGLKSLVVAWCIPKFWKTVVLIQINIQGLHLAWE